MHTNGYVIYKCEIHECLASCMQNLLTPLSFPSFENKGAMMGCSNPHPHGQAWTLSYIPMEALKILQSQKHYHESNNKSILLLEYAKAEIESQSPRIVVKGDHFAAMVPYWAVWPFEVIICPTKRHIPHLLDLNDDETEDLASVIRKMTCKYDNRKPDQHRFLFQALTSSLPTLLPSLPMLFPIFYGHLPSPKPE